MAYVCCCLQEAANDIKSQEVIAREVSDFMTNIGSVRVSVDLLNRHAAAHEQGAIKSCSIKSFHVHHLVASSL